MRKMFFYEKNIFFNVIDKKSLRRLIMLLKLI